MIPVFSNNYIRKIDLIERMFLYVKFENTTKRFIYRSGFPYTEKFELILLYLKQMKHFI